MKKIEVYKDGELLFWGSLIKEDEHSFYIYIEDSNRIEIKFPKNQYTYHPVEVK